jgi:hypothetical protein
MIMRILDRLERPLLWSVVGFSVWFTATVMYSPWSWNMSQDFVMRVIGEAGNPHTFAALSVIAVGPIAVLFRGRKGMFAFPLIYGFHEFVWNIPFMIIYAGSYSPTHLAMEMVSYAAMMILSAYYLGLRYSGFLLALTSCAYVPYLLSWAAIGFPISVQIGFGHVVTTANYLSYFVNAVEVGCWVVPSAAVMISMWLLAHRLKRFVASSDHR